MWKPSPPQGFSREEELIIIGRPPIPQFAAPQGVGGEVSVNNAMVYEDLEIMAYESNWLDTAFLQRIPLTINGGQVPSTQNDFPLLINDTYPDLIGEVEAELRFAGLDKIQLEYEIQKFDNVTGELIAWVKKPSLSDGDIIFIYFDNLGALDEQNPNAVWDSDYKMVLHLQNDFLDSTSNANNATNNGTTNATGKIGDARDFDGVDDFLRVSDSVSLQPAKITISAWIQSSSVSDGCVICKEGVTAGDEPYKILRVGTNTFARFTVLTLDFPNALNLLGSVPLTGVFHLVTGTMDGTTMKLYVDGILDNSVGRTGDIDNTAVLDLLIGARNSTPGTLFDGIIDEPHISSIVRSDDYILTEFNNQNDNSTFYSTGAVESLVDDPMGYE